MMKCDVLDAIVSEALQSTLIDRLNIKSFFERRYGLSFDHKLRHIC